MPRRTASQAKSPTSKKRAKPKPASRTAVGPAHDAIGDLMPCHESYAQLASRVARGEVLVPPLLMPPHDRRRHVRRTLLEDHRGRVRNRPESVAGKFDAMAKSAFRFFRGTALLYYRDYAGSDGDLPVVLCLGDVHPANYGVMPSVDGTPVFGPNDFDEAHFAPFTWDLKRGAVGFDLAGRATKLKRQDREATIAAFLSGYLASLEDFARSDREVDLSMRIDNSPPIIRELLDRSLTDRRTWLAKLVDLEKSRFRPTDEIVPASSRVGEFQKVVDSYRNENELGAVTELSSFQVKDVACKKGSGTASLGLERFFVLIDGPTDDVADDLILEIKQSRPSALTGLVPNDVPGTANDAERVVTAHRIHVAGGDPYYGTATLDGTSCLIRERSPFKRSIDLDDLDTESWAAYADVCGRTLALAHARSDADTGVQTGEAEQAILESVERATFIPDLLEFATAASRRVRQDVKLFTEDLKRGAFGCGSPDDG